MRRQLEAKKHKKSKIELKIGIMYIYIYIYIAWNQSVCMWVLKVCTHSNLNKHRIEYENLENQILFKWKDEM
jgi:hypothetical protein